jgi:uncharacterized protein (TIGR02118 family)
MTVRVQIWARKSENMSDEEFGDYWITKHAPIARDGYANLQKYVVHLVTRVPGGRRAPYDGMAELKWEDRQGFKADMDSEANRRATEDLAAFTSEFGLVYVDEARIK